jgi:chromosome segregation protein
VVGFEASSNEIRGEGLSTFAGRWYSRVHANACDLLSPVQITKLRLAGFKSFVHPTELAIESGLTGVVGPNGCGKSNLIDALRWVMGETSARGLRGGEMDDVIFAGTGARPAFDLAEVGLHIEAPEVALPGLGELDDLDLSRRIGRGVGSVFRVNGKELRARDVQLLFADAASGARSAAIVGQGQIGALLDAKPGDRRRLIEEAAGVGGLQARRHEAELKLQAAEANLVRVQDLLLALEEQHQSLCKQARQAERYRKLSAACRQTEAALLVGRSRLARAELVAAEAALCDGRAGATSQAELLTAARLERERAAEALAGLRAAEAELATELARLSERLGMYDDQAARIEGNRARLEERERQIGQDVAHGEASLEDARATEQRLAVERRALATTIEQLTGELDRAAAAEAEAEATAAAADAELRQALTVVAAAEAGLRQLADRREQAGRDRQALADARQDLDARLAELAASPAQGNPDGAPKPANAVAAEVQAATAVEQAAEAALEAADQQRETTRAAFQAAADRVREAQERRRARQEQEQQRQQLLERQAELDRRRARLAERAAEIGARTDAGGARRAALELPRLEDQLAAAERALGAADADVAAADMTTAEAGAALERARRAVQEQQLALDRLQTEAAALAQLAGPGPDQKGVVELVRVDEGYAEALAAALGDDLIAGLDPTAPSHWRAEIGSARPSEVPALPAGCRPLAEVVTAPPALARRLAQVGVVEPADASQLQPALAQGQRLVSRDGGLWRWDGLVRRPEARDGAATRLRQQSRRRQLESLLTEARERLARAENAAGETEAEATEAAGRRQSAARERETARAALERLRETVIRARAEDAALAAGLGALAKERAALEIEGAELEGARRTLSVQLEDLPAAGAEEADARHAELDEATAGEAAAADQDRQAEAAQAQARTALQAARARLAAARDELERQRAAEQSSAAAARTQELERARIEAKLLDLERQGAELDAAESAIGTAIGEAEAELATARSRLAQGERAAGAERQARAEAGTQHARLSDRLAAASARSTTLEQELAMWSQRSAAAADRLVELAARRREVADELARMAELPATLVRQQAELRGRLAETEARRAALQAEVASAEAVLAAAETELERIEAARVEAREAAARLEARLERAQADAAAADAAVRARLGAPPEADDEALPSADQLAELEAELGRLGAARERLGAVNLRAIDEAAELALRIQTLQTEQAELTGAIERLRRAIATLNREGRERLQAAFAKVESHFEALFTRLFGGGRARLSLTDEDDPLAAGLDIAASPPGKKLQSISLLSGGEKALTALALIFAVFLTNPAPLCVLDEVDAPLDDANVERLMALLEELALGTRTRFLVVTHHPLTMARMHRLYGVTMAERGISRLVSVDLTSAVELRAIA